MGFIDKLFDYLFKIILFVAGILNVFIFMTIYDLSNYINTGKSYFKFDKYYNNIISRIVNNISIIEIRNSTKEIRYVINYDTVVDCYLELSNNSKKQYKNIKIRDIYYIIKGLKEKGIYVNKMYIYLLKDGKRIKKIEYNKQQVYKMFNL